MARQYVTYKEVKKGLCRPHCRYVDITAPDWVMQCEPTYYLQVLRRETGLSWAKLAHDLSVDSGCKVSGANAKRWAS